MKKVLALMLVSLAMFSCRQENKTPVQRFGEPILNTGGTKKSDSFYSFAQNGYLGQLPYIVAGSAGEISEFNTRFEIAEKIADSTITWEYLDSIYKDDLTEAERQNVAVFVLRNKDLIGLARENPQNLRYTRGLTKYIDVLVDSKYFGYCLLYSALQQCHDRDYVNHKAAEIVRHSITETFHQTFLNDPGVSADWRYQKVEEDLTFLSKLRDLQN